MPSSKLQREPPKQKLKSRVRLVNDPTENNLPDKEDIILALLDTGNKRKFNHKVSRRGLATASLFNSPRTILMRDQLLMCADSYTNDGIVRIALNKLIFSIKGDRIKQSVSLNEELLEGLEEAQLKAKQGTIFEQLKVVDLRKKMIRVNKRVHFDENVTKWMTGIFTFGRGAMQIIRSATVEEATFEGEFTWPRYGQPIALIPLNALRIVDTKVDPLTQEFEGFLYNYGESGRTEEFIPAIDLVPGWNDDANLYDNTPYSGISLLWPILSVSQSNQVCNDEDVPESFRAVWAKWGHFYTSKKSNVKRFTKQFEAATMVVHTDAKAKAEVFDMARSLLELTSAREANAKFLLWCIGIPLFIMFEDTANFATANEALQAFKAISIKRYRTWLANMLERYWYDPMLADHLNVDISEVIAEEIKTNAVFEDILFETKDKTASYLKPLADAGYIDRLKLLKELGYDDVIDRLDELEEEANAQREESIIKALENIIAQGKVPPGMDEGTFAQIVKTKMNKVKQDGAEKVINVKA